MDQAISPKIGNINNDSTDLVDPGKRRGRFLNSLALMIFILSGGVLLVLIFMAWHYIDAGKDDTAFKNIKDLMSILLPLIGTWMGTILAFYFSKENFEAANQRVKELVKQITTTDEKLQVLKASDVMSKPGDFPLLTVKDEDDFKQKKIKDVLTTMTDSHTERLPILQAETLRFIFLLYRTTIERFIIGLTDGTIKLKLGDQRTIADKNDLTINDMFQSDYKMIKDIIDMNDRHCFMSVDGTLDKVKQAMQDNTICQDVFITQTGDKDEPIAGWITNNMIIEKAELFKKAGSRI